MSWRNSNPSYVVPGVDEQMRRARRIERAFRKKHGVSSMEHLSQVMKGVNEVFEDCHCYACMKHFYEKKSFAAKLRTMKAS